MSIISSSKQNTVKHIFLMIVFHGCVSLSMAQLPASLQTAETKQMVAELKREIVALEADIKTAEKEDPDAVASMKKQLNVYKNLLANFDLSGAAKSKSGTRGLVAKEKTAQTRLPVTPVLLKQPVLAPTAIQAVDYFFGQRGRKINDSTLVTTRKTIVQYSRKKQQLVIQPDEKKDSFFVIAKRIARGEQRKRELAEAFDRTKNGFIYYPYLINTLARYDDLTDRFSEAVNNTISFGDPMPRFASPRAVTNTSSRSPRGPNSLEDENASGLFIDSLPNAAEWVNRQLDEAQERCNQLPSVDDFPAPTPHELGRCAGCDTAALTRQRLIDAAWVKAFQGKEGAIFQQALSAMRAYGELGEGSAADEVNHKFRRLQESLNDRMHQKESILLERYGDQLPYLPVIIPVLVGNERQRQLLGAEEHSEIGNIMRRMSTAYNKYYQEQMSAKNHDFILNVPFHLGVYRQLALLGGDESAGAAGTYLEQIQSYNRFALTMETDFVWQRDAGGKLEVRATGNMETKEKMYIWLYPDSCGYRILPYGVDLNNRKFADVTLPMKVNSGVKTVREENDQLKDYPYQGASEYAFRFPDSKINFCGDGPDTLFLAIIGGDEQVAERAGSDLQNIAKSYSIDFLMYAGQVLINEDANELESGIINGGNQILNTISGFMQQPAPESTLDKLKIQYTGYMEMDNQRKFLESAFSSRTARVLFNAANRSTVLTDTYLDTKRKMENEVEIKRGMFHLRIVHEPKK